MFTRYIVRNGLPWLRMELRRRHTTQRKNSIQQNDYHNQVAKYMQLWKVLRKNFPNIYSPTIRKQHRVAKHLHIQRTFWMEPMEMLTKWNIVVYLRFFGCYHLALICMTRRVFMWWWNEKRGSTTWNTNHRHKTLSLASLTAKKNPTQWSPPEKRDIRRFR